MKQQADDLDNDAAEVGKIADAIESKAAASGAPVKLDPAKKEEEAKEAKVEASKA